MVTPDDFLGREEVRLSVLWAFTHEKPNSLPLLHEVAVYWVQTSAVGAEHLRIRFKIVGTKKTFAYDVSPWADGLDEIGLPRLVDGYWLDVYDERMTAALSSLEPSADGLVHLRTGEI